MFAERCLRGGVYNSSAVPVLVLATVPDPEAGSEPPKVELEAAAGGCVVTGVLVFGLGAMTIQEMSVDLMKVDRYDKTQLAL